MKYRKLGTTGLQVSEVSLGCMSLKSSNEESIRIIHTAIEQGINVLDTADLYDKGENEILVGKAIGGKRDKIILATKVGNQWKEDGSGWNWNPTKKYILEAVEKSLQRLGTDYIDLYQLHGGTIEDPFEETLEAFQVLQEQGKIRFYGISSIRPNVIRKWMSIAKPATMMLQYSLLDRRGEEEVLPLLQQNETGVFVRGSLAQGMLVNKEAKDYLIYTKEQVAMIAGAVKDSHRSPVATALQFVLHHPAVSSAVIGISTVSQLREVVVAANEKVMDDNEYTVLANLLRPNLYTDHR